MSKSFDFKYQASSIVLVGDLDPLEFTPKVLDISQIVSHEDILQSNVKAAGIDVLVTSYPWFELSVTPIAQNQNKLVLSLTDYGYKSQFLDLIVSLLHLCSPTTLSALGINFTKHIQHKTSEDWHDTGHMLVPSKKWTQAFDKKGKQCHVGVRNLSMKIETVLASVSGYDVKFEPELNIDIRPTNRDHNRNPVSNYTELTFNYHFPLTNEESTSIDMAQDTIKHYYNVLNDELTDSIEQLLNNA
ncbi:hypothetical protein ACUFKZ_001179 [Vibrio fluvialis]|nr:hypothetical protein [Vibrio fluvialis]ELP3312241.1 hypothetical protein [Vibrio fluvialis]